MLRELARRPSYWTVGLGRYAGAHVLSAAGDAFVNVSLASSLFFSISPDASREQVLLYLVINLVPFTLLAPLIGPAIDRFPRSHRFIATAVFALRAALAVGLALTLHELSFYFFALALLIANRATGVVKQALVPSLVDHPDHLVATNSRLSRLSLVTGTISVSIAAGLVALTSAQTALFVGCVGFVGAAVVAARLPDVAAAADDDFAAEAPFLQLHAPMVRATAWAFTMIRAAVGFFTFGVVFALRRASEPALVYGAIGAAWAVGTFVGNAVAPVLRRRMTDDRLTAAALLSLAVVSAFGALGPSRLLVGLVALVLGLAASIGRQGFDALVQRVAPRTTRGTAFARFETQFQFGWVVGAIAATAVGIPVQFSLAAVAVAMLPSALFYVRNIRELRLVGADEPLNPIGLLRRRLEKLDIPATQGHRRIAAIELASVADLARAANQPVAPGLLATIDGLRRQVLDGAEPDDDDLQQAINAMRAASTEFDDPMEHATAADGATGFPGEPPRPT